jgi:hypothetical protein
LGNWVATPGHVSVFALRNQQSNRAERDFSSRQDLDFAAVPPHFDVIDHHGTESLSHVVVGNDSDFGAHRLWANPPARRLAAFRDAVSCQRRHPTPVGNCASRGHAAVIPLALREVRDN